MLRFLVEFQNNKLNTRNKEYDFISELIKMENYSKISQVSNGNVPIRHSIEYYLYSYNVCVCLCWIDQRE